MSTHKKERRERAIKKAKLRRNIIIAIASAVILAVAAAVVITVVTSVGRETYSDGQQAVTFYSDGSFRAMLLHNNTYSGTYVKTEGGMELTYGPDAAPVTVFVQIDGDALQIPSEWDDGHGHAGILMKR